MKRQTLFLFVLAALLVNTAPASADFAAVWRPAETAPSNFYDFFYLVDDRNGDIILIRTKSMSAYIVEIVYLGNVYTGEVTFESRTRKWLQENPDAVPVLAEIWSVTEDDIRTALRL